MLVAALVVVIWLAAVPLGFRVGLTLLVILGLTLVVVGVAAPPMGAMGVGLLCVLDAPARVFLLSGGILRWNTFNYLLVFVILFFAPLFVRFRNPNLRWAEVLMVLLAIELTASPGFDFGVQHLLDFVSLLGLFVYLARTVFLPSAWYWMAVVGGLAGAGAGLLYYPQAALLPYINENAWSMCSVAALFAACLAFRSAQARPHGQLILGALATVNGLWVFLSGSRGSLAIAVFSVIYLLFEVRSIGRRVLILGTAILLSLAVFAQFTQLQDRTLKRIAFFVNPNAPISDRTSGRTDLARGGVRIFERHPLGVGTGGFANTWENLDISAGDQEWKQRQAHSAWVKILAENGVPGIILLFGFVISYAYVAMQSRRPSRRRLGIYTSATLGLAFFTTEFQPKALWLLAAGAATVLGTESLRELLPRKLIRDRPRVSALAPDA